MTHSRVPQVLSRTLIAIVVVIALAVVGMLFWASMVMRGERTAAIEAWTDSRVQISSDDSRIVLSPTSGANGEGLVFIPGARVDPYAYMNVLRDLVGTTGTTVVITKPVLHLAFFDPRPLDVFTADLPQVRQWAVGGHSLGGVRACQWAEEDGVAALVLFGSYCANDLSATGLPVLSIGGSEDGLSTPQKIADAAHLLPADAEFVEVPGLNHAGFGDYGVQSGDGVGTLTDAERREAITAALWTLFPPRD